MSKKKTQEEFESEVYSIHSHIKVNGQYNGDSEHIDVECLVDGYCWSPVAGNLIHLKRGCPVCAGRVLTVGVNDLWTTRPDVAMLLKDPEEGYKLRKGHHTNTTFVCPHCGSDIVNKVSTVCANGLSCKNCSDGFSYPNKLMRSVLKYLGTDFQQEYSPDWIGQKRYDFYFCMRNREYIVEMDGGIGHGNKVFKNSGVTLQDSVDIDNYKDMMAKQHGIDVIRIDCEPSEFVYIKQNIINALSDILDLSNVDWAYCDAQAQRIILIDVCKYYADTLCTRKELISVFRLHKSTIKKYLRKGYELGLCPRYIKRSNRSKKVLCVSSGIVFVSASHAASFYNLDVSWVLKCCKGIVSHVAGMKFVYLEDYQGDVNKLTPNYSIVPHRTNALPKSVNVYNVDGVFIGSYESIVKTSMALGASESSVRRSCQLGHIVQHKFRCYFATDPTQPDQTKIQPANNNTK